MKRCSNLQKKIERVNYLCVIDPKHELPTFDILFHIFKVEKINTYGSILNFVVLWKLNNKVILIGSKT